jgi:hypothetical protein
MGRAASALRPVFGVALANTDIVARADPKPMGFAR